MQRGAVALTTALRISTLLPRERDAIFSILRTWNIADELMPRLAAAKALGDSSSLAPIFAGRSAA
jgi:hypothetical protein